jgi:hypothetical protein
MYIATYSKYFKNAALVYEFSYKTKVLVPGKPFQPSQTFAGKVRSLPKCVAPKIMAVIC